MVYSTEGVIRAPWPGAEVYSYVPPPDVTCSLKPDYIRLDHGVIGGDAINGSTASTTAVV